MRYHRHPQRQADHSATTTVIHRPAKIRPEWTRPSETETTSSRTCRPDGPAATGTTSRKEMSKRQFPEQRGSSLEPKNHGVGAGGSPGSRAVAVSASRVPVSQNRLPEPLPPPKPDHTGQ